MRGCSIRAIWIFNRSSKVVFSRRFPTVERQWRQACLKLEHEVEPGTHHVRYQPLPFDAQVLQAFVDRKEREGSLEGRGLRTSLSQEGSDSWVDDVITRHVISLQLHKNEDGDVPNLIWPVVLHLRGTYQILILPMVEPQHLLIYEDLCWRNDCGGATQVDYSENGKTLSGILLDLPCITGAFSVAEKLGDVVTGEVVEPEMYVSTSSTMGGLLDQLTGGIPFSGIGAGISGIGARAKPVTVPVAAAVTAVAGAAATATSAIAGAAGGKSATKSDKDALRSFVCSAMPFGTPLDLNYINLATMRSQGFSNLDAPHPEQKQPAWKPYLYRGKQRMVFTVHEVVTAALYDQDNVQDIISLDGQVLCRADLEGLPDITVPLTCPSTDSNCLTFHPCAQTPEQSTDKQTITFSPPLGNFVLARFTALPSVLRPPLQGFYQLSMVSKDKGAFLIRMKLMEGYKAPLLMEHCSLSIPFPRRRVIGVDGTPSVGTITVTEHAIDWKIIVGGRGHTVKNNEITFSGTVKFSANSDIPSADLQFQDFAPDAYGESDGEGEEQTETLFQGAETGDGGLDPAEWEEPFCWDAYNYAKASFKIVGGTMSGVSIDTKMVSVYPQMVKPPCEFFAQVVSGDYIFWNSLGRYPQAVVPKPTASKDTM